METHAEPRRRGEKTETVTGQAPVRFADPTFAGEGGYGKGSIRDSNRCRACFSESAQEGRRRWTSPRPFQPWSTAGERFRWKQNPKQISRHMNTGRSEGRAWVVAQMILMCAQLTSVWIKRRQWPAPASRVAGGALVGAAAVYGLPGFRTLGRNLTPLPEPKASGELVTTGIYAHVRHPLYAAVIAGGFGWALLWRSWPALLLAGVQAAFLRAKAKNEEERLAARFPGYASYARRVPRFLPRLSQGMTSRWVTGAQRRPAVLKW